jgi:hypothetical protein
MSLNADQLRDGLTIAIRCVGGTAQNQFLQGSFFGDATGRTVGLTASLDDAGTEWTVQKTANAGIFAFECARTNSPRPDLVTSGFLKGQKIIHGFHHNPPGNAVLLTLDIDLTTSWRVSDLPAPDFSHVTLQFGDGEFLTGQPNVGNVRLFQNNSANSAAHWELIPLPVSNEGGGPDGGGRPK